MASRGHNEAASADFRQTARGQYPERIKDTVSQAAITDYLPPASTLAIASPHGSGDPAQRAVQRAFERRTPDGNGPPERMRPRTPEFIVPSCGREREYQVIADHAERRGAHA